MSRKGFTLIEVLIVISISAVLAAISLGYSSVGRDQTALSVEETKVAQFILQARTLAIATYGSNTGACGYGVSFDAVNQTYSLFAYAPGLASCPQESDITPASVEGSKKKYTSETWQVHIGTGVVLSAADLSSIDLVLFYPPDPTTLLVRTGAPEIFTFQTSNVHLVTSDGMSSKTISVNSAGQVSF
jgi:prepilin-type N-terminal cleavage/methylation domain-containing protein